MYAFKSKIPMTMNLLVYIILSGCSAFAVVSSKNWIHNNDWENTRNWNLQRLPCADDIVRIDLADGGIFLNSTTNIKELKFSKQSSIVLGDSAEIVFDQYSDTKTCKGGEISFTGFGSNDWFDPRNWQAESRYNDIGLYSQQIPCQFDTVTFPQGSSYNVEISKNVTVAKIVINGKEHNENEFQQYIKSRTGVQQIQLKKSASFHITGKECRDISGCVCDNAKYEEYICSFGSCPKVQCDQPVKPFGGCCSICGNLLLLNVSNRFDKASIEKEIQAYLQEFPGVIFASTKYKERGIQVALWDSSNPGNSKTVNVAHSVRERLLNDEKAHVISIEILPKLPTSESSKSSSVNVVTIGSIAAGVVVVIALIALAVFILLRRKNSRHDVNTENRANEGEIGNLENPTFQDHGVNPLYEASLEMETPGFTNALTVSETSKDEDSDAKENPLYELAVLSSPADD